MTDVLKPLAVACLALIALSPPALAQGLLQPGEVALADCSGNGPCVITARPTHNATGYPDLDRAVAICDAHEGAMLRLSQAIPPPTYLPGYEACTRVIAKRDVTEQASREREARVREETDRKFLADFVGRLKP